MRRGRSGVFIRRSAQAVSGLRDSSTTPRWLKSGYPQRSFICSTVPEDAPLWPVGPSWATKCLIHVAVAVLARLRAMRTPPGNSAKRVRALRRDRELSNPPNRDRLSGADGLTQGEGARPARWALRGSSRSAQTAAIPAVRAALGGSARTQLLSGRDMPRDGSLLLSDGSALFPSRLCANLADGKDAIA
jgi:hypothetical protein